MPGGAAADYPQPAASPALVERLLADAGVSMASVTLCLEQLGLHAREPMVALLIARARKQAAQIGQLLASLGEELAPAGLASADGEVDDEARGVLQG